MKYIIEKSYNEFVGEYEVYPTQKLARAKGYEAHHIIPRAVQKRIAGTVYDDRCVRLTYFEHILAHYLYCKEHPEDINEHIALERMCNTREKKLLADEKTFLEELPQMAEMREKGVQKGENHYLYGKHHSEEWRRKHSESMKGEKNPMYGRTGERGSFYGKHHSEEQKKVWSESIKGDKNPMFGRHHTEEAKQKISEAHSGVNHHMYGKHHSEDTRKKISEAKKGKMVGKDNPFYGKHHSEETRKKIAEALTGEKSPNYGKHLSEEARKKLSEANKGKHLTEEVKRKISEAKKGMNVGEKNPSAKKVFQRDLNENIIQVFSTVKEAGIQLGKSVDTIRNYIHGKTPKNMSYTLSYN